ncbi:MAG: NUDIX domain-containing protein [Candidatus Sericytochromatia bacterium]|nr:NUDIX domain-containing protein [Candidatus Sericytochromatia bacterium]
MDIHEATAVYVFDPDFTQLLFVRHRKPPLAGRWLPPGGHVDAGETPEEGAVREVFEETGQQVELLDMTPDLPRHGSPRAWRMASPWLVQVEDLGDHRHLDFVYVAVATAPGALITEPDQPARWWGAEAAEDAAVLEDCRTHAAHLFAQRERFRSLWQAQRALRSAPVEEAGAPSGQPAGVRPGS